MNISEIKPTIGYKTDVCSTQRIYVPSCSNSLMDSTIMADDNIVTVGTAQVDVPFRITVVKCNSLRQQQPEFAKNLHNFCAIMN